ncbi:MAG: PP2C family protein-serine/threonine phosphatase [Candidatus Eisenbacteria bacterium]|nr:PP2C family protein-serine/threonine phosphatase [Candidatus Eisenbacteria bacterium]
MSKAARGNSSQLREARPFGARAVWLWALGNSLAGLVVGIAIYLFAEGDATARGLILMSIVFANVVGFAAVLTARFVLPRYSGLTVFLRVPLAGLTLVAGGVLGSGLAMFVNPLMVFYQLRLALMVLTINGVLALAVGLVTYTYEQMRAQMENDAAERGKLEHEMNIARDIQMELLPKSFPKLPGLDMFAFTVPARHVGGDCYDVIDTGDGRLAITIGDVSGKGTPAAILMANVQAAVRVLSESQVPAVELVTRVNKLVHGYTEDGVFITFFYSVLDTRTGELIYVNAGHNPPCILRADGRRDYLDRGGLVVGLMAGSEYDEGRATLHAGDDLVLYTDGVTEAENPDEEMFGEERLEQLLIEHRHASAREIEEQVYTSIKDFAAGASQTDDLTMVIVKMTSDATDEETTEIPDSPRIARGGSPAARGAPATGALWGPATASSSPANDPPERVN